MRELKQRHSVHGIFQHKCLNTDVPIPFRANMSEDTPYGRPCRACTDFKSWMKTGPKGVAAPEEKKTEGGGKKESSLGGGIKVTATETTETPADHHLCPPDRMELGNSSWSLLHSLAAYYPARPSAAQQEDARQFMQIFSRLYPCQESSLSTIQYIIYSDSPPQPQLR